MLLLAEYVRSFNEVNSDRFQTQTSNLMINITF